MKQHAVATELAEAWKRAAVVTERLHLGQGRKAH
jgi:hypothetical protein